MSEVDFLLWVKGSAFTFAVVIFVAGVVLRLFEILALGRAPNYAEARDSGVKGGFREIWKRFGTDKATFNRSLFTVVAGYVFHIGLFVVIFLLAAHVELFKSVLGFGWPNLSTPVVAGYVFHIGLFVVIFLLAAHVELFKSVLGFGWPNLSTPVVDAFAVVTMMALIALLVHRLVNPVKRFLSTPTDYVVWAVTFLPLLTGYMAYHHLLLPPQMMLGLHILSVEILMIVFPFTKLMHTFTLFISRWYSGYALGVRGIKS